MKKLLALLLLSSVAQATLVIDDIQISDSLQFDACTPSTVPYFDSGKLLACSAVTPTELGYLSGVTSSIQAQIAAKAPLASPALTGNPTAPTQTQGDNSTKVATTAYADTAVANATIPDATTSVKGKIKLAGDLAGTADLPTVPGLAAKANSASPSFTGTVTAPAGTPSTTVDGGGNVVGLVPSIWSPDSLLLTALPQTDPYSFGAQLLLGSFGNSDVLLRTPSQQAYGSETSFQVLDSLALTPTLRVTSSQLQSPLSGMSTGISYYPTVNSGGTAGYTSLLIDTTEASLGSGVANLVDLKVDGVSKFVIDHTGTITTGGSGGGTWGSITGTLSNQTDLQSALNAKQATGSYITALTSDVSASGPGSAAATVNSVGGSTAAAINTAEILANAATSLATANALMKRGSAGEFSAGVGTFTGISVSSLPSQQFYVTKDNGNDANDCSLLRPCKTIQAGINAANAISAYFKQTIVHVAPSSGGSGSEYVENITFAQQGVNLVCDNPQINARACFISGTITVNMTGTSGGANYSAASNESYMNGFVVSASTTNNDLVFSGSTFQRFLSINNYFDQNGTASSAVISNTGTSGGTASAVLSFDTTYNNSNATNPAVNITSGARFWMYGTTSTVSNGTGASGPAVTQSGAGSSAIFNLVQLSGQYNLSDNTATASFNLSTIASGTNPCAVTPSSANTGYLLISSFGCNSTNTNTFTGSGILVNGPGNARFGSSGDPALTITQLSLGPGLPQGEVLIGPGSTTGTNVALSIKDGHIKIAQTTAPTTTLSANAGTGGSPACTLSHATDSGGYISLKTGTASWATGTQCTINFNKAWTTIPVCTFSRSNDAAAVAEASQRIVFPDATTSAQTISAGVAFASQVTPTWHYHCMETQ